MDNADTTAFAQDSLDMIIISYDGTPNDDDALALGKALSQSGAPLALAYVRHSREFDPGREELAQHDAERRLEHGATWLEQPDIDRHVVVSASTGEGLAKLAGELGASLVVFGSDYRTSPGRVEPGTTAQRMLEGGSVPIAVAPAGLRAHPDQPIDSIAVVADGEDPAAHQTAGELAKKLGARLTTSDADLVVVGSQATAPKGRIALSGATRSRLNGTRAAVIVVPHGVPVTLD